jgi:hypothetical protein
MKAISSQPACATPRQYAIALYGHTCALSTAACLAFLTLVSRSSSTKASSRAPSNRRADDSWNHPPTDVRADERCWARAVRSGAGRANRWVSRATATSRTSP